MLLHMITYILSKQCISLLTSHYSRGRGGLQLRSLRPAEESSETLFQCHDFTQLLHVICHEKWGGLDYYKACKLRYRWGCEKHMTLEKSRETFISLRPHFQFPKTWEVVPRLIIAHFSRFHVFPKVVFSLPVVAQAFDMSTRLHLLGIDKASGRWRWVEWQRHSYSLIQPAHLQVVLVIDHRTTTGPTFCGIFWSFMISAFFSRLCLGHTPVWKMMLRLLFLGAQIEIPTWKTIL